MVKFWWKNIFPGFGTTNHVDFTNRSEFYHPNARTSRFDALHVGRNAENTFFQTNWMMPAGQVLKRNVLPGFGTTNPGDFTHRSFYHPNARTNPFDALLVDRRYRKHFFLEHLDDLCSSSEKFWWETFYQVWALWIMSISPIGPNSVTLIIEQTPWLHW